jgi:glycosyltransferase involved in cell wall biosynthesis
VQLTAADEDTILKLCLICYPYFPSRDTGRGLDRYLFELNRNLLELRPAVKLHLLHQGFSRGAFCAAFKQSRLIADLLLVKSDIYHAATPVGGATAALLGKSPLVVTIHDLLPFDLKGYDSSWKQWYMRFCTRISVKKSDAIIVGHNVMKQQIISRFNVPGKKIQVIRYGVDQRHFHPRLDIRRSSGKVLFVGEVSRSKGVDILIRAFGMVKTHFADAELVIAGKCSKDQKQLEGLCREAGVRGVTFAGYVPEEVLPDYYASAAVMVFPSRCGFGLTPLEAMACGTPVIVGDAFDAPEFLGDAGILVPPGDPDALAQSIVRVLKEPALRKQLSSKAIERAKDYAWEKMARETLEVYRKRLHPQRRRG